MVRVLLSIVNDFVIEGRKMLPKVKQLLITIFGFSLVIIGAIFIILPGPAFIFLPIGLAMLSLHYAWAKVWLKRSQRVMRESAVKLDKLIRRFKYR